MTPIRVYEAIADAGGFREYANLKDVIIMRGMQRIKFNAAQQQAIDANIAPDEAKFWAYRMPVWTTLKDDNGQLWWTKVATTNLSAGLATAKDYYTSQLLAPYELAVANAGISGTGMAMEMMSADQWNDMIGIDLTGVFYTIRSVIPGMKQQGYGRIVAIASSASQLGLRHLAAYSAAKHAVVGMTKVAAIETADHGITVNAICPGWVRTPLVERQLEAAAQANGISNDEAARRFLAEKQPMAKFTTPESIGAMAVFLCSDAAEQITGTDIPIDGGWTAG